MGTFDKIVGVGTKTIGYALNPAIGLGPRIISMRRIT
jgi:glycerol uptake facilitator-like aquaporin